MIYTSYFAQVRNLIKKFPNMYFFSIAGKTPKWFIDDYKNCYTYKILAPKYYWWKEWHDKFIDNLESEQSRDWYIEKYNDTVLKNLNVFEVKNTMINVSSGNDICFVCYESSEKFCHRHIVADWMNKNGIECKEIKI